MHDSKYIQTCTPQLALEVGENLRREDAREVEQTMGLYAPVAVLQSYYNSAFSVYFTSPHGKAVGVAGVTPGNIIWMLCTDEGDNHPHTFVREAKRWIESRKEKLLWNYMDPRNKVHLKLLKFLGFKFLRKVPFGPNQLPFIEFCRVRRSSSC